MHKKYPRQLSQGANNKVVAIDELLVAKLFGEDNRSDIGSEAAKLKLANQINSLIVKFDKVDFIAEYNCEAIIMERLYPLDYRIYEYEKRLVIFEVFEDELLQLHKNGFVHRDLKRPSNIEGDRYDNIFLTDKGLRLIDVGVSALKENVGSELFQKFVEIELTELAEFKQFFLNR